MCRCHSAASQLHSIAHSCLESVSAAAHRRSDLALLKALSMMLPEGLAGCRQALAEAQTTHASGLQQAQAGAEQAQQHLQEASSRAEALQQQLADAQARSAQAEQDMQALQQQVCLHSDLEACTLAAGPSQQLRVSICVLLAVTLY